MKVFFKEIFFLKLYEYYLKSFEKLNFKSILDKSRNVWMKVMSFSLEGCCRFWWGVIVILVAGTSHKQLNDCAVGNGLPVQLTHLPISFSVCLFGCHEKFQNKIWRFSKHVNMDKKSHVSSKIILNLLLFKIF